MNTNIRQLFPVTQNYTYLNHAAVAPISLHVYEAMQRYTQDLLAHGLVHWREWAAAIEQVRGLAAQLIHAQPHEIAFAPNTSSGLSIIANGISWRAGDNVVTADCEFPANQQPWFRLQKSFGVEIRQAKERAGRMSFSA
jgi:cysteine desulfurase / selenocysteine lyase